MKNKYKSAAIWNIVCGVLYTLSYIGTVVLLGMGILTEDGDEVFFLLAAFLAMYLWEIFMTFPFLMILTGGEMLSKHKKGAGVKAFIIFNAFMKLFAIAYNALFGYVFLSSQLLPLTVSGVGLFLVAALIFVSIVMDFRALFKKQKILDKVKTA